MTFALDSLVPALTAALFASLFCLSSTAQAPDADGRALLERIDRLRAAEPAARPLVVEGSYTVTMGDEPVAKGRFRDVFGAADLARHTSDMGPLGKMERGVFHDLVWEVDPQIGAKVHRGVHDRIVRRWFTWVRGAPIGSLYAGAERIGAGEVDGHACEVWQLQPKEGPADVVHVDDAGTVHRLDIALPTPESADATWNLGDEMPAQITFGEWTEVDGLRVAKQRRLRMGPAVVTFVCDKVLPGAKLAEGTFAPPPAIEAVKTRTAGQPAFGPDGKPNYVVDEREPQPIASIRTKCKASDISKTLATLLPEVHAHVTAVGGQTAGPPFTIYHAVGADGGELEIEAGLPVAAPIEAKGRVQNGVLPGGRTLTVWHVGRYEGLAGAHAALQAHAKAKEYRLRGPVWEVYWTDPGMVPDPTQWRTQLFQPIE